jgi:hypothetical protein
MDVSVEVMPQLRNSCSLPQLAEKLLDLFLSANAVFCRFGGRAQAIRNQQLFL